MTGTRDLVAVGHPATAAAAVEVIEAGGNAFDAAVAAGLAAAVAEPLYTSLGGGGFLLARTVGGDEILFDFFVDTPGRGRSNLEPHFVAVTIEFPGSDQVFNTGVGSAAVPGTAAGYLHVHRRLGRLALDDVVAPAIALAEQGLSISSVQAEVIELLWPIVSRSEEARAGFGREDRPREAGDRYANPALGEFLTSFGRGPGLYGGDRASRIAADMADAGGLVTTEDLAAYRVVEREPLAATYRGRRVLTNPAPAFGGELVARGLELLDAEPAAPEWQSPGHLERLVETMISLDDSHNQPAQPGRIRSSGGTTQVTISDREGNVASMTTSNGEGSGYLIPGTGIMLNNMLGEDDLHPDGFHAAPSGERVSSMMAPTLVLGADGVELAIGSGGSKRIRTALLQAISATVDFGAPVADAVEAPRVHWDGDLLQVEPGLSAESVRALGARWPVNEWSEPNMYFGGVHAVVPGRGGAADHRRGGVVCVVD